MSRQLTVNQLKKIELEDIQVRKQEIKNEIGLQKDVIVYSAKRLFNPYPAEASTGYGFRKMGTGIAIIDGAMVGYRMIKRIKGFFRRR